MKQSNRSLNIKRTFNSFMRSPSIEFMSIPIAKAIAYNSSCCFLRYLQCGSAAGYWVPETGEALETPIDCLASLLPICSRPSHPWLPSWFRANQTRRNKDIFHFETPLIRLGSSIVQEDHIYLVCSLSIDILSVIIIIATFIFASSRVSNWTTRSACLHSA